MDSVEEEGGHAEVVVVTAEVEDEGGEEEDEGLDHRCSSGRAPG